MKKTVKEHLEDLPEPARSKALKNMWWEDAGNTYQYARDALYQAFNWSKTKEGTAYWRGIFHTLPVKD